MHVEPREQYRNLMEALSVGDHLGKLERVDDLVNGGLGYGLAVHGFALDVVNAS